MSTKQSVPFQKAVKSFLGYLEGTLKSVHTQESYAQDLRTFTDFWTSHSHGKIPTLAKIQSRDLRFYFDYLKSEGLRSNSRRRKILTLKKFFKYVHKRGYLNQDPSLKLIPPNKVERIPRYFEQHELISKIQSMSSHSFLDQRNKTMIWILAETGCTVSQLCKIQYNQFSQDNQRASIHFSGESDRTLEISLPLYENVLELQRRSSEKDYLFLGHNRFGDLGSPISSRGIELFVKWFGKSSGFPGLTPRTLRHSAAIAWLRNGKSSKEVQQWLGLNTPYSLRIYEPLLKKEVE